MNGLTLDFEITIKLCQIKTNNLWFGMFLYDKAIVEGVFFCFFCICDTDRHSDRFPLCVVLSALVQGCMHGHVCLETLTDSAPFVSCVQGFLSLIGSSSGIDHSAA